MSRSRCTFTAFIYATVALQHHAEPSNTPHVSTSSQRAEPFSTTLATTAHAALFETDLVHSSANQTRTLREIRSESSPPLLLSGRCPSMSPFREAHLAVEVPLRTMPQKTNLPDASPTPAPSSPPFSSSLSKTSNSTQTSTSGQADNVATYDNTQQSPDKPIQQPQQEAHLQSTRKPQSPTSLFYELYEHEIYNPSTMTWTSRRFTQSPITGGGGRDSTSLNPQTCPPPRGTVFQGEWKIDISGAGETRDGFGWEYYVGRYDGLGRRRRRWLRNLRRVVIPNSEVDVRVTQKPKRKHLVERKKQSSAQNKAHFIQFKPTFIKSTTSIKHRHPQFIRFLRDQYNFKGFGWSFHKSLLARNSLGASFRLPLSANLDVYDRHMAWPSITSTTYFGYPWVVGTFINASLPVEAVKWAVGGIVWKFGWVMAVLSAFARGLMRGAFSMIIWPLQIWRGILEMTIKSIHDALITDKQGKESTKRNRGFSEVSNKRNSRSNGFASDNSIELVAAADNGAEDEISASASKVMDSPRGGATTTQSATSQVTENKLFGHSIPPFYRSTTIQYSSTIQERIGFSVSWRVSKDYGYEFRWNFFYTCLPTLVYLDQVEKETKQKLAEVRRRLGINSMKPRMTPPVKNSVMENDTTASSTKPSSSSNLSITRRIPLSSFWHEHTASLGFVAGWPLPMEPFFSLGLLLSLSGFYYEWLPKRIASLFVLSPKQSASLKNIIPSTVSVSQEEGEHSGDNSTSSNVNSKPVISMATGRKLIDPKGKLTLADTSEEPESEYKASPSDAASSSEAEYDEGDEEELTLASDASKYNNCPPVGDILTKPSEGDTEIHSDVEMKEVMAKRRKS